MFTKGNYIFMSDPPATPGRYSLHCRDAIAFIWNLERHVNLWLFSPPYYKAKTYGVAGEIGQEEHHGYYISYMRSLAGAILFASKPTTVVFMVIKDSRNGSGGTGGDFKEGDSYLAHTRGARIKGYPDTAQLLIPERLRIAFTEVGWLPLSDIIWNKNDGRRAGPRRTSDSYEHILVFAASENYQLDREAVLQKYSDRSLAQLEKAYKGKATFDYASQGEEDPSDAKRRMVACMKRKPGAYLRDIWNIPSGKMPRVTLPSGKEIKAKASYPLLLAEICVLLGSNPGDLVCDPFVGMGQTILAAVKWGRNAIGNDLDPEQIEATRIRLKEEAMRTYPSHEAAERDSELDLKILWKCDRCGREREDYPGYNEGGSCPCGGQFYEAGETYRG